MNNTQKTYAQIILTWDDVIEDKNKICNSIKKDRKNYDVIVSSGRGGLILSTLIAELFNIKELHVFNIYSYIGNMSGNLVTPQSFDLNILNNKKILVVDDVCTTGKTLKEVVDKIKQNVKYQEIDIVTEFYNILSKNTEPLIKPTYYAQKYNADINWIVFPWER